MREPRVDARDRRPASRARSGRTRGDGVRPGAGLRPARDRRLRRSEGLLMAIRVETRVESAAAETLARARDHLLSLQHRDGWWKDELETNVTMDAEDLLLRRFLGVLTEDDLVPAAAWIRSKQGDDGTWANFYGGPGDLSTTVESYAALRLAGDPPDASHMRAAR